MLISIAFFVAISLLFVKIFSFLKIPDVVSMIFAGIFIKFFNLYDESILSISDELRQIALIIIILRAGFSLDLKSIKKIGKHTIMLSFLPAMCEITSICLFLHIFLDVPYLYGLIAGCTVSAVSPAIIIPRMIKLQKLHFGTDKNIPELITISSSLDDILVIILFYTFISIAGSNSLNINLSNALINSCFSLVCSIFLSLIIGFFLYSFLSALSKYVSSNIMCIFFLVSSFFLLEIEKYINFSALLSILLIGILYSNKIKKSDEISISLSKLWDFFSIILFVLVGLSVDFSLATNNVLIAMLTLVASVILRCMCVLIGLFRSDLLIKERIFCALSFIPKATVQASLGYIPLSLGLPYGELILSLSTLSIIIFATIGALFIDNSYKFLLNKE